MKITNGLLCNALVLASLLTLPAMAADGGAGATVTAKGSGQACTAGGAGCSGGGYRHSGKREGFRSSLKLSDDQLEKMASLKNDFRTSTAPEKAQLKSLSFQLKETLMQPAVDKDKAMALEGQINNVRSDLSNKRLSFKIDSLNVLTAEQKEALKHRMLVSQTFGGGRGFHHRGGGSFRAGGEHRKA